MSIVTSHFQTERYRADFPVLNSEAHGKPLVYLDNAATTQKPQSVIDRMSRFYESEYGTVRRGVYALSAHATTCYENARQTVADFLGAQRSSEILFTKGTTEAINLVATSYGRAFLKPGDEVLISAIEHHANIVPWQQACLATGALLKVIPVLDSGELDQSAYVALLSSKTKVVAVNHVSNALGTINPIAEMIAKAHGVGAIVLIDGAQSAAHLTVDVQALDCDFYAFSGHKLYGPTGIGVLYGKAQLLDQMPPYQFGGEMIESVTFEKTTFAKAPRKFEPGTPPIVEVIGLEAAIQYIQGIGLDAIHEYETHLLDVATEKLSTLTGLRIIGQAQEKASVISFVLDCAHPHDIGTLLDREGVAIRAGHHCAQPVMERFGVPATARASFSFYNTESEVDRLVQAIETVIALFGD